MEVILSAILRNFTQQLQVGLLLILKTFEEILLIIGARIQRLRHHERFLRRFLLQIITIVCGLRSLRFKRFPSDWISARFRWRVLSVALSRKMSTCCVAVSLAVLSKWGQTFTLRDLLVANVTCVAAATRALSLIDNVLVLSEWVQSCS